MKHLFFAAARLQRWSLLLISYQYEIEFKASAEVSSSDTSPRLPLQYRKDASVEDKIFQMSVVQLLKHPVSVLDPAYQTARNPVLAKARTMTQNGVLSTSAPLVSLSHFSSTRISSLSSKAAYVGPVNGHTSLLTGPDSK